MLERLGEMMDDTRYQLAFQIILHAGNSKSKSMIAMKKARAGEMDEAVELIPSDGFSSVASD